MVEAPLVICPVFNEQETVENFYKMLRTHYRGDVLFVDDGSTDSSKDFLLYIRDEKTSVISHPVREGYGATLISGFDYSLKHNYRRIITLDVDLQHNPANVPTFLQELKRYDAVLGSRYISIDSFPDVPAERFLINRCFVRLIKELFHVDFSDPFCGYRGYRDSFLRKACLREKNYGFALEVLLEMVRTETVFKEISVEAIYFDTTRKFLDGFDNPQKRFLHYLDVILQKKEEMKNEAEVLNYKPASR